MPAKANDAAAAAESVNAAASDGEKVSHEVELFKITCEQILTEPTGYRRGRRSRGSRQTFRGW
jgi:hypothetical protein